jgi:hypothetical protein
MSELQEKNSITEIINQIKYLWNIFISHWIIIISISIILATGGLLYSIFSKPNFIGTLEFALDEDANNSMGSLGSLASQFGLSLGGDNSGLFGKSDNIIELFQTRNIISKVLLTEVTINNKKKLLINHYIDFNNLMAKWKSDDKLKDLGYFQPNTKNLSRLQDSVITLIYQDITENLMDVSKPNKKTNIISVTITSKDEQFSKLFVENISKVVSDFYINYKTKKAKDNISILQNRADSVKNILYQKEYELANFKDKNQNLIKNESYLTQARLQRDVEILDIMNSEIIKNLELAKLTLLHNTPLIQIVDNPVLPLERKKLRKKYGILIFGALGFILSYAYFYIKTNLK